MKICHSSDPVTASSAMRVMMILVMKRTTMIIIRRQRTTTRMLMMIMTKIELDDDPTNDNEDGDVDVVSTWSLFML